MPADDPLERESYLFGDSDLAARRLQLLANVFEPSTREFLQRFVALDPGEVLDLGCGPGYSTRLLAELFPQAKVLGVDNSARFIELARARHRGHARFEMADVTRPLPGGPYHLIFGRYLLTHLAEPAAVVAQWSQALEPGGAIAVEENDAINTLEPAFAKYLHIVAEMLAAQRQQLYVGQQFDQISGVPRLAKTASECVPIRACDRDAAAMFAMNIRGWRDQIFITQNYSQGELDSLQRRLDELAGEDSERSSIIFIRRRLVFTKTPD